MRDECTSYKLNPEFEKQIREKLAKKLSSQIGSIQETINNLGLEKALEKYLKTFFVYSYQDDGARWSNSISHYAILFYWDGSSFKATGSARIDYNSGTEKIKIHGSFQAIHEKNKSFTIKFKPLVQESDFFHPS